MKPLPSIYRFEAIGTHWSIETDTPLDQDERTKIDTTIAEFDSVYSRFRADSLVSRIAHEGPGTFTFPDSIIPLLEMYYQLEKLTGGAVNPLVGASLERLGYDRDYSLREHSPTPYIAPSLASCITLDGAVATITSPVLLDIGAIGKGYLVDVLSRIVRANHTEFVIDGSGDVAVHRDTPEIIGLEDPHDSSRVIGTVNINEQSLCGSAMNRRAWGNGLHHIIDARTGRPAETDIIATWAIADSTLLADALATALFFTPVEALKTTFGDFFCVTMKRDGRVEHNITAIGEVYL